jgi:hypothetical protein
MRHLPTIAFAVVVAASSWGCALTMDVPDRFLIVENEWGSLRALTPEESKLWVREFGDDSKGSLTFWRDALKGDLIAGRGYTLIDEGPITDGDGREGVALTLETTLSGRPVRELMAVFVVPGFFENTIRVAEYVTDKATFDGEVAGVRAAISTLR